MGIQILAPRIGYLPLLIPQIKPHFSNALPPGSPDTVWFDYNGLPLKWSAFLLFNLFYIYIYIFIYLFWVKVYR